MKHIPIGGTAKFGDDVAPSASRRAFRDEKPTEVPLLLTDSQAAACLGISVRKFHDLRAEDWMPRPVSLGPRLRKWSRIELERAIAEMPRQQSMSPEPYELLRTRIARMKQLSKAP